MLANLRKNLLLTFAIVATSVCSVYDVEAKKHHVDSSKTNGDNKMATWKLEDLYKSPKDERLVSDQALLKKLVLEFRESYKGHVSLDNLNKSLLSYEKIYGLFQKVSSYALLYMQTRLDEHDALAFYQSVNESLTALGSQIVFYTVEITNLDYKSVMSACEINPELGKYKSWFKDCFRYKDHLLSGEVEEALSKKSITSSSSWARMHEEILAKMEIDYDGSKKTLSEISEIANHSDDEKEREKASKALGKKIDEVSFYIKHAYNNIILDCSIDEGMRKYEKPESFRHVSNNIDQKSVDSMTDAVISGYKKTSHRYYKLKAKLLGKKKLEYWDRNAKVKLSSILDKKIPYEDGCNMVLESFGAFSKEFKDIANDFMHNRWIDVYPKKGKASGAFACATSYDSHPYVLLNYFGTARDVSTLAHELGHGIHQTLAAKNGPLLADTPLTLSETASLFAEKMLFERMFKEAKTNSEKIDLLCSKLDDTINSVMRQIAFFEFERRVHAKRAKKELSVEEISAIWMEAQKECLGEYVNLDKSIASYWCVIPHFYGTPFYVYSYAFGEMFVNALYACYEKTGEAFIGKYIKMLQNGGTERYDVAASKFGLNPNDKEFWKNGVDVIAKQIDKLENLCD